MATQIVMDRMGDTRHNFDAKNADALAKGQLWVEAAQAAARVGETAVSLVRAQKAAEVEPARASTAASTARPTP